MQYLLYEITLIHTILVWLENHFFSEGKQFKNNRRVSMIRETDLEAILYDIQHVP